MLIYGDDVYQSKVQLPKKFILIFIFSKQQKRIEKSLHTFL